VPIRARHRRTRCHLHPRRLLSSCCPDHSRVGLRFWRRCAGLRSVGTTSNLGHHHIQQICGQKIRTGRFLIGILPARHGPRVEDQIRATRPVRPPALHRQIGGGGGRRRAGGGRPGSLRSQRCFSMAQARSTSGQLRGQLAPCPQSQEEDDGGHFGGQPFAGQLDNHRRSSGALALVVLREAGSDPGERLGQLRVVSSAKGGDRWLVLILQASRRLKLGWVRQ